ncbi:MAG: hypothetical protein J0I17_11260 ['Candidatus Kapabacteria' thiocyanatum]|nr:hypothetical protein ['Candidatus Kapabacteria' thiocyanatum]
MKTARSARGRDGRIDISTAAAVVSMIVGLGSLALSWYQMTIIRRQTISTGSEATRNKA